jgi:pantoate--beta-alanine ligase
MMYPAGYATFVDVEELSTNWEGAFRPGHFRGVATIVLKLFNCLGPDVAYFGRKDYQQQALIRKMCHDLNVPVEIRTCPTVREADGLALSSRNQYLSPAERQSALSLSQCLRFARNRLKAGETDVAAVRSAMREQLERIEGIQIDYVTVAHPETLREISEPLPEMIALVAARIGRTRLIDNLLITL